jgi:UDPglucose--hexose-1-phosphate uridylyltransferase
LSGAGDSIVFDPGRQPHRRLNALTGEWVVVSPQRTQRPWDGQTAQGVKPVVPQFDPDCYLCPGNERAGGVRNPNYDTTFVFQNDFPALLDDVPSYDDRDGLFQIESVDGECRVICFSPRHDLSLAAMDGADIERVIGLWQSQFAELSERYRWVQIFETRGAISGASNAHPHGQIWASSFLPTEAVKELGRQREYLAAHGSRLLVDYAAQEEAQGERIVVSNDHWQIVVPYWAYWPFETLVIPRRPVASLLDLDDLETTSLAAALRTMLRGFDNLFDTPFPYCSGWHNAPRGEESAWQLHAHYYPPLLRSADVAKIPASYELLANLQRDLTPETAADALRTACAAR